jgi:hypothetical protein
MPIETLALDDGADRPDTPVNLAAVQADEALLNLLHSRPVLTGPDAAVVEHLLALRADVDSEPYDDLITADSARDVIDHEQRRRRTSARLALAGAILIITIGVVGILAASATPDDLLWPVTKVLYPEHVQQIGHVR